MAYRFLYNAANDSIANVMDRINNSAAGVTASYDTVNDRFVAHQQVHRGRWNRPSKT